MGLNNAYMIIRSSICPTTSTYTVQTIPICLNICGSRVTTKHFNVNNFPNCGTYLSLLIFEGVKGCVHFMWQSNIKPPHKIQEGTVYCFSFAVENIQVFPGLLCNDKTFWQTVAFEYYEM